MFSIFALKMLEFQKDLNEAHLYKPYTRKTHFQRTLNFKKCSFLSSFLSFYHGFCVHFMAENGAHLVK